MWGKSRYKETRSLLYVWFNFYFHTHLLKWFVFFLYLLSLSLSSSSGDVLQQWVSTSCSGSVPSSSVFGSLPGRSGPSHQQAEGCVEVRELCADMVANVLCLFFNAPTHFNGHHMSSVQEHALSAGDLQHHADGPDGRCCQTGESLSEVCEVLVCALLLQVFLQNKALEFYHSRLIAPSSKYKLCGPSRHLVMGGWSKTRHTQWHLVATRGTTTSRHWTNSFSLMCARNLHVLNLFS